MNVFKNIFEKYVNPDRSIRATLFNIITGTGIIGGTVAFIISCLVGLDKIQLWAIAISICILYYGFYIANWKGMYNQAAFCIVALITLILFPVMFVTDGGLYGGMGYWFVLGIVFNYLLLEGISAKILVVLQIIVTLACYLYGYLFPERIVGFDCPEDMYIDTVQSVLVLAVAVGLIVEFQQRVYNRVIRKLDEANRKLTESEKRAEEASMAKSEFLSTMSHEIRTPINAVLGMTDMILRESNEKKILQYAADIDISGNALLSIINDVLDISKIESGNMEINNANYEIKDLARDCRNLIKDRAEKKGLNLKIELDPDIPSVLNGDVARIRQIVVNFLTNAVKYTQKGYIELKISGVRDLERNIYKMRLEVKDTGMGIKEEALNEIFEKFRRFDLDRNRTIEGTGLGLAICRQLAELMGGIITVDSVYGEGSLFTVILPQVITDGTPLGNINLDIDENEIRSKYRKETFKAPGKSILVVDDVEMNIKVFLNLLKDSEMYVETASSGYQCLEMTEKKKYDLVFLDHMMPGIDGITTMEKMKEGINKDTLTVMLTANALSGMEEEYLKRGFDGYLAKPVKRTALEKMLKNLLL